MRPPTLTTTAGLTRQQAMSRLTDLLGAEVTEVLRDANTGGPKAVWGVELADGRVVVLGSFERMRETEALKGRLSANGLPDNQVTSANRSLALRKLLSHCHTLEKVTKR